MATECYDFQDTWLNPHRQVLPPPCPSPVPPKSCPPPQRLPGTPSPAPSTNGCVTPLRDETPQGHPWGHPWPHPSAQGAGVGAPRGAGRATRSWRGRGGRREPRSATPRQYQPCCQQPCLFPACMEPGNLPELLALGSAVAARQQFGGAVTPTAVPGVLALPAFTPSAPLTSRPGLYLAGGCGGARGVLTAWGGAGLGGRC